MRPSFLELNPKIPAFTSSFNVSTIEGTFFSFFLVDGTFVADNERFLYCACRVNGIFHHSRS